MHGLTLGHVACAVSSHEVKRPVIPLLAENKLAYTPLIFRHMQDRYPLCHPKKAYTFRTRQPKRTSLFRRHTIINFSREPNPIAANTDSLMRWYIATAYSIDTCSLSVVGLGESRQTCQTVLRSGLSLGSLSDGSILCLSKSG